jgi:hypothetical protein
MLGTHVDVNVRDVDHWTPLMHAAYNGHTEVVRLLIQHGADLHAITLQFETAYELAHKNAIDAVLPIFEQLEVNDLICEGVPRWYCPFCGHWSFVGEIEGRCEHFLAPGGMDVPYLELGPLGTGSIMDLIMTLEECMGDDESADLLVQRATGRVKELLGDFWSHGQFYWTLHPDVHQGEIVSVDEASGTWLYWDYFAPDAKKVIEELEIEAQEALAFLQEHAGLRSSSP